MNIFIKIVNTVFGLLSFYKLCPNICTNEMGITMGIFDNYEDVRETRSKSSHHIKGIVCDVKNCAYHDGDNYCTADKIAVGPSFATSSADTVCASFKPKALL